MQRKQANISKTQSVFVPKVPPVPKIVLKFHRIKLYEFPPKKGGTTLHNPLQTD